jgi:valyl-tRNA synthetase
MSKTRGNVIDPLVITEQYGADALRFTLAALTAQGRDIKLARERIEGYRAFANKLWNATRFALMNLSGFTAGAAEADVRELARTPADRWILARLQRAVNDTVEALEAYRFNDASNAVYHFVWHELCDWYIELAKDALYGGDPARGDPDAARLAERASAQAVLVHALETSYRLLHPLMPFITEELWQTLKGQVGAPWGASIVVARYPATGAVDDEAERSFGPVIGIVEAIRNIRGEMNIPFKVPLADVEIGGLDPAAAATVAAELARIARLANVTARVLPARTAPARRRGSAVAVGAGFELRVGLAGAIDVAAESARIAKEVGKVEADLAGIERKLANPSFVERAPAEVVEKDRARAEELREKRRKLEAHRDMLAETENAMTEPNDGTNEAAADTESTETPKEEMEGLEESAGADESASAAPQGEAETAQKPKAKRGGQKTGSRRTAAKKTGVGRGGAARGRTGGRGVAKKAAGRGAARKTTGRGAAKKATGRGSARKTTARGAGRTTGRKATTAKTGRKPAAKGRAAQKGGAKGARKATGRGRAKG